MRRRAARLHLLQTARHCQDTRLRVARSVEQSRTEAAKCSVCARDQSPCSSLFTGIFRREWRWRRLEYHPVHAWIRLGIRRPNKAPTSSLIPSARQCRLVRELSGISVGDSSATIPISEALWWIQWRNKHRRTTHWSRVAHHSASSPVDEGSAPTADVRTAATPRRRQYVNRYWNPDTSTPTMESGACDISYTTRRVVHSWGCADD